MNTTLSSRSRHYITKVGLSLLILALIASMTGCAAGSSGAVRYDLTVTSVQGGSVDIPGEGTFTCDAGRIIDLSATPNSGYRFVNWTGDVDTINNSYAASTTITMDGDYSITANFEQTAAPYYTLTMAVTGSGSTSPDVGQHTRAAGTDVYITASPASGYRFVNWTAPVGSFENANAAETIFTMPGQDIAVTANFEEAVPYTLTMAVSGSGSTSPAVGQHTYTAGTPVTISASPASGYYFSHWTAAAGSFTNASSATTTFTMPGQDVTVTANFEETGVTYYTLTTSVSPSGGGSVSPIGGTYAAGSQVTLTAMPASGYSFSNWGGDASGSQNPITITMNGNYSITANFSEIPEYELTISSTAGGSVTNPGEGTFTYDAGTLVSLAATPSDGYAFVRWTGDIDNIANVNDAYTTITMNGDYSITANFEVGDWVFFPDAELEAALREAIGKPTGRIYKSDLEELTSLSAAYRGITDLTGLEHCINLVSLDLHDNRISDISPLAGLTNLEWLDLSYNRIGDISPLAGLTKLKWLYLYNNLISDISPLVNLTSLIYLFLHTNQISDISPLTNLTNLTRLLLSSNQISDISPLTNLTKLTWLYLHKNQISNISPLANLTNLIQLDLSDNQVSGIAHLANLTNLTYLSLYSNQISNISYLANLTNLMWLYLHNNLIADIYPLVQNGGLGTGDRVYLDGNPLSEVSINTYIPEIVARGVIVSYDM
jgi:Leucine-rich repeat (LRR) protein